MSSAKELNPLPLLTKSVIIVVTVAQAASLLMLDRSLAWMTWPYEQPLWLFVFFTLFILAPVTLVLAVRDAKDKWLWLLLLGYACLLALLASYTGYQCEPAELIRCSTITPGFMLTMAVSWFILLSYFQTWLDAKNRVFSYTSLFDHSWHNYLSLKLVTLFVGVFWGILGLWAMLFSVLDIDFFTQLFSTEWFIYPVTGFIAGCGLIIVRTQLNMVQVLRRILRVLLLSLLPVLCLLVFAFLTTLPFTGLELLWKTGYGSSLILWLTASVLFFCNAVYQDVIGERPYNLFFHRVVQATICALIVLCGLSLYGLSIRIGEYGWTVARLWGITVAVIFTVLVIAYAYAIVRKRDVWTDWLGEANKALAMVVVSVCIAVNTPLLDFRSITIHSQLERLELGQVAMDEFDYRYLASELGRDGYYALEALKSQPNVVNQPKIIELINIALKNSKTWSYGKQKLPFSTEKVLDLLRVYPVDLSPPESVLEQVYEKINTGNSCVKGNYCYLISIGLGADAQPEYVFIDSRESWALVSIFQLTDDGNYQLIVTNSNNSLSRKEVKAAFDKGDFSVVKPRWNDLLIGKQRISINR